MTDDVRQADIVSPALRFAMIADRAEAALMRVEEGRTLRDRDRKALENAIEFLREAELGFEILQRDTLEGYSLEALKAYEAREDATKQTQGDSDRFLDDLNQLMQPEAAERQEESLSALREFFHVLTDRSLAEDVGEIERVNWDEPGYVTS